MTREFRAREGGGGVEEVSASVGKRVISAFRGNRRDV